MIMTTMTPLALVVDDEQTIQSLLRIFLEREGFVVNCASSISEAEPFLTEIKYDLIIADIYLGKGTGIGRIIGGGAASVGRAFGVTRVPVVKNQAIPAYDPRTT